jgi:hypothetical protein
MVIVVLLVLACIIGFFIYQGMKPAPVEEPESDIDSNTVELHMFGCKDSGYYLSVWPNVGGVYSYIEFNIAGITFHGVADKHLGEFVGRLVPEPDNPHDPNAIRIESPDGARLGYVPKDRTNEVRAYASLPCPCCCFIARHGDYYVTDCYIKK